MVLEVLEAADFISGFFRLQNGNSITNLDKFRHFLLISDKILGYFHGKQYSHISESQELLLFDVNVDNLNLFKFLEVQSCFYANKLL